MDVKELLRELRTTIETARAMPMSSSAVINRATVLDLISRLESALPAAFAASDEVVEERDSVVSDARHRANEVMDDARAERARMVSDSEVYRAAQQEAQALRAEAERDAAEFRTETDEYVDGQLAQLELSLTKTLDAVSRGRARLHGRSDFDPLGDSATDDPVDA